MLGVYTPETWNMVGLNLSPRRFERVYADLKAWHEANANPPAYQPSKRNGTGIDTKHEVLKILAIQEGLDSKQIASKIDAHPRSVSRALAQLTKLDIIERRGKYLQYTYYLRCSAADAASGKVLTNR